MFVPSLRELKPCCNGPCHPPHPQACSHWSCISLFTSMSWWDGDFSSQCSFSWSDWIMRSICMHLLLGIWIKKYSLVFHQLAFYCYTYLVVKRISLCLTLSAAVWEDVNLCISILRELWAKLSWITCFQWLGLPMANIGSRGAVGVLTRGMYSFQLIHDKSAIQGHSLFHGLSEKVWRRERHWKIFLLRKEGGSSTIW